METVMQDVVVALVVPLCGGYAAWKLMPAAARRALAGAALRWPAWPAPWRARLTAAARLSAGGCGCDGCDRAGTPGPGPSSVAVPIGPVAQPIVIHRRKPAR